MFSRSDIFYFFSLNPGFLFRREKYFTVDSATYCTKDLQKRIIRTIFVPGEMAEWSIAAVLKTVELQGSGGSNPSLSADYQAISRKIL